MALDHERPVDAQAEPFRFRPLYDLCAFRRDRGLEFLDTPAGHDGRGNDRSIRQKRVSHQLPDVELDDLAGRVINQVTLGESDHAVFESEQPQDFQVLSGLRHDGVIGRDDEQGQVDAGRPGEHVLDEPLMPGAVHNSEPVVAEVELGEPNIDGDAAGLLLRQAVAVRAGEGFDERGLAVVDVAGGAEDQVAGHFSCRTDTGAGVLYPTETMSIRTSSAARKWPQCAITRASRVIRVRSRTS